MVYCIVFDADERRTSWVWSRECCVVHRDLFWLAVIFIITNLHANESRSSSSVQYYKYKLLLFPAPLPRLSQPYMLLRVSCSSLTATTRFAHSSFCPGTASFSTLYQIKIIIRVVAGGWSRAVVVVIVFTSLHCCEFAYMWRRWDDSLPFLWAKDSMHKQGNNYTKVGGEARVHDRRQEMQEPGWFLLSCVVSEGCVYAVIKSATFLYQLSQFWRRWRW